MKYDHSGFYDADKLVTECISALRPPPNINVAEWAEENRRLSQESSASPGRFSFDKTPYFREPLEMVNAPGVESIALMTSAQVGKSTCIENIIGYFVHLDPCPILHISPTIDSMKMFSKERLAPMIRDTPVLKSRIKDAKSRDSNNTIASKSFPGGHIAMVGSNAPAGLASRPIRVLVADEIDRFERSAGTEGDPLKLGIKRTTTYHNRLVVVASTPGDKYNAKEGTGSRIEREFEEGDQRHYHVKCPHCDHEQTLRWSQVKWDNGDPDTAVYVCEEHGCVWSDKDRYDAIKGGRWIASKPFNGKLSYHLSQLYSMFTFLSDGVRDWLESQSDPNLLKTWVNTFLGESWEEKGERLEWSSLRDQREDFDLSDEKFPDDVTLLTCAVDVQDDRLEYEICGWGDDYQSWSMKYAQIYGDLSTDDPWDELRGVLKTTYIHPTLGELPIRSTTIDSGGHYTQKVYDFCESTRKAVAIKGVSGQGRAFVGRPMKNTIGNARVFPLGVDVIKDTVVDRLKVTDSTKPGYCRFTLSHNDDYFRGITAEQKNKKIRKGFTNIEWIKIRNRNEPFDLRVYNTAALEMLSLDLKAERRRLMLEVRRRKIDQDAASKPKPKQRRRKSTYLESWRDG